MRGNSTRMTRRLKKFCFLAVICLFGLHLLVVLVNEQGMCMSLKELQRWIRWPKAPKTRLLVIGQGRSGTSFVSKMMAIGEQVSEKFEIHCFPIGLLGLYRKKYQSPNYLQDIGSTVLAVKLGQTRPVKSPHRILLKRLLLTWKRRSAKRKYKKTKYS